MPKPRYEFRKVAGGDYPMLRRWLAEPHIEGWWGTPDEELALIEQDIATGPTDMRIVSLDGQPFAFVQDYPAQHWPMPQYFDFPKDTRAIDTFLGDPAFLGQGHASGYLRQRALELLAVYPKVVIDPSADNVRAVRAYRAAGFTGEKIVPCEDGEPVVVMEFNG